MSDNLIVTSHLLCPLHGAWKQMYFIFPSRMRNHVKLLPRQ